jgi:maltose O-acetyltransferase
MATEKEKMLAGELYNSLDPQLVNERRQARELTRAFNATTADEGSKRKHLLIELLGSAGSGIGIEPPFFCDYGYNIHLGDYVFFNFNCVILDVMRVEIGSHSMFGPAVQIYTATHPLDAAERRSGLEFAKPIKIGCDVWVGGSVVINPGVTIGDRSVIGAGSVVVKDIPADVFAAGNPCKVIRYLKTPEGLPGCNVG